MPNNDDQLQQQYQEILNKYASSITPPPIEPNPITNPELSLIDSPVMVTPPQPESEVKPTFIPPPPSDPEPIVSAPINPPIYFPESPTPAKPSSFFKYLFYLSLLIFVAVAFAIIYTFSISQSTKSPVVIVPTPTKTLVQFCELNNQKIAVGQSIPSSDSCNTCTCNSNLTISCTEMSCISPTPTVKPVTKVYKDTKYGYQFECPVTFKYTIEATSVNGNKIPYKQESCTNGESVTTVSVYDNTVVHDFGNTVTQVSPNKKYITTLEGDDSITASFKFL